MSPNQLSSNLLSPASTVPARVCEVKTFTVYETEYGSQGSGVKPTSSALHGDDYGIHATPLTSTPSGGKPTPSSTTSASSHYEARPTGKVAKPFGQKEEYFTYNSGEDIKMQPCSHWSENAKDPKKLMPKDKTQLYYAEGGRDNASKCYDPFYICSVTNK